MSPAFVLPHRLHSFAYFGDHHIATDGQVAVRQQISAITFINLNLQNGYRVCRFYIAECLIRCYSADVYANLHIIAIDFTSLYYQLTTKTTKLLFRILDNWNWICCYSKIYCNNISFGLNSPLCYYKQKMNFYLQIHIKSYTYLYDLMWGPSLDRKWYNEILNFILQYLREYILIFVIYYQFYYFLN